MLGFNQLQPYNPRPPLPNRRNDPFYRPGDQGPFGRPGDRGGPGDQGPFGRRWGGNNFYGGDKLSDEAQMRANIVYSKIVNENNQNNQKGEENILSPILQLIPLDCNLSIFDSLEKFQEKTINEQIQIISNNLKKLEEEAHRLNQERYTKLLKIITDYSIKKQNDREEKDSEQIKKVIEYVNKNKAEDLLLPYNIISIIRQMFSITIINKNIESLKKQKVTHLCISPSDFCYFPLFKRENGIYTCLNYFTVNFVVNTEIKCIPINFNDINNMVNNYNNALGVEYIYNFSTILNDSDSLKYIYNNILTSDITPINSGGKYYSKKRLTKKYKSIKKIDKKKNKKTINKKLYKNKSYKKPKKNNHKKTKKIKNK